MKTSSKMISFMLSLVVVLSCLTIPSMAASDGSCIDLDTSSLTSNNNYSIFTPSDLTDDEIENLCNYINGDAYVQDAIVSDVEMCGNEALFYINEYYERATTQRDTVPSYLTSAYNKVNRNNQASPASIDSNSYIISEGGHFKIFYNEAENVSNLNDIVYLLGVIYDSLDAYLCDVYDFNRPTTDGTYYEIHLIASADIDALGYTHPLSNNRSYIELSQGNLVNFYYDSDEAFILGTAIHEYMHAIMFSYGIQFSTTELQCFHEAMGRAVGIEYETTYANNYDVCSRIRSFVNSLGYSFATVNTSDYKYGSALFYLFLFEDYDEWSTIQCLFENYDFSCSIISNIDSTLYSEYNSSFKSAYIHFLSYNVDPDHMYDNSPTNRMSTGCESWGTPVLNSSYSVTNSNVTFSGNGSLPYSAGHYIKLTSSTTTNKQIDITINFGEMNGNAASGVSRVNHRASTNTYGSSTSVDFGNQYHGNITMSISGNDVVYIVIANTGLSGTLSYNYVITISD